jgi:hypothetical protein
VIFYNVRLIQQYAPLSSGDGVSVTVVPMKTAQPTISPEPPLRTPTIDVQEALDPDLEQRSQETLDTLLQEQIPINDLVEIGQRLTGVGSIPETKPVQDLDREIGEQEKFWVTNVDTNESFQITANLEAKTDHLYFWIEDGISFSESKLNKLANTFENEIYPTNRNFFGSEWSPGVDLDPRLYIIYARNLGGNLAGYFSSVDEYHPLAHEYSNAHETFMLNADTIGLGERYTYGVLAHEFQHMIHWYRDTNETSWLNEGFSELATFLNGYQDGGFDYVYAQDPDLQLNDWPNDPAKTTPHYGSSFLFVTYFLDRFGNEATQQLVAHDLNGLRSIDALNLTDPETGQPAGADDIFLDWVMTNYLQSQYSLTGRYAYNDYGNAPNFYPTETLEMCPTSREDRTVHQYGVDYVRLDCEGEYTLHFDGADFVGLLPEDAHSGDYAYWSNKGDHSNMTLTREFDFSEVPAPITLEYWTWYDLEQDYDYLYLEASLNGEDWTILKTPSGTDKDLSGNSYGWAYNGLSGGDGEWIKETVDLSDYAGERVQIRFEYITDAAVHGEGFLLDDVSIPEIGYQTDFEDDNGGWTQAGFVRVQNILPQTFRLALLSLGDSPQVEYITLTPGNELEMPVTIGGEDNRGVILVVTGTTRFTRQLAEYQFQIQD